MKLRLLATALLFLFVFSKQSTAQTTLSAGDIAFVGYNCQGTVPFEDEFSFVLLTPVSANTQIHFTDFGWCSDINGFQSFNPCGANTGASTDGAITWTSSSALPCGTQVRIVCYQNLSASVGSVTGLRSTGANSSIYMNLGNGGESIFAFQGSLASPSLISALNMNGGWDASLLQCAFNSAMSTLPSALTSHNLAITPERDNGTYNCTVTSNSPANLRAAIYNNTNWNTQDLTPYSLPLACTFSCSSCTAPAVTGQPPNRMICANGSTTFGITATGTGLSYQWQVNTGSGFNNIVAAAPYTNSTTATLTITGASASMSGYAYRCVVTGTCGNATSNAGTLTVLTVSGSTVISNVSCFNGSNGSINLTPSGGIAPYIFNWGGGITTEDRTGLTAGNYSVIVTDNVGCTGTVNATVTQPTAVVSGSTLISNVSCFSGSNGSINLTPSGGTAPYTYNWGAGITTEDRTGLSAGNYSVIVTDANSCTGTVNTSVTQPASAVSGSTVITNISCSGASNGSIDLTPTGGTPGYTYNWGGGITTQDRSNIAAGNYSVIITDANSCTGTVNATVTQPSPTPGSNNYSLPTSNETVISMAGNSNYVTASCELVSTVIASGSNPVSGSVTNKVWIEGVVPTQSAQPFVQRHYEITPASGAATATGTVTLYFTQAEFDNFNAHPGSPFNLPTGPADATGKANLRIGKYSGVSGDGSGLPSSYSGSAMVIDPDNNNIVWNNVSNTWEITFAVDGFSGFIVQTSSFVLPVEWVSFTVKPQGQEVRLNWSTASEQNTKDFFVQHSIDGVSWVTVASVPAAGNSSNLRNYAYVHHNAGKGDQYYRIMQTDLDGNFSYSEIRQVNLTGETAAFTIAGTVIKNGTLQIRVYQTISIALYELNGKLLLKKQFAPGVQRVDVSRYAKGVYLLNANGKSQKIFIE